jgi:hypothetical protein
MRLLLVALLLVALPRPAATAEASEVCADAPAAGGEMHVLRVGKLSDAEASCPTGNCDDFTVMEGEARRRRSSHSDAA